MGVQKLKGAFPTLGACVLWRIYLCTLAIVMCVPFGRPTSRWQRPRRHNWAVMGESSSLYM